MSNFNLFPNKLPIAMPQKDAIAIVAYVSGQFSTLQSAALAFDIDISELVSAMNDPNTMALVDMYLDIANSDGRDVEGNALRALDIAVQEISHLISNPDCPPTALVQAAQFLYRVAGIEQKRSYEGKEKLAAAGVIDGSNFSINIIIPENAGGEHVINTI